MLHNLAVEVEETKLHLLQRKAQEAKLQLNQAKEALIKPQQLQVRVELKLLEQFVKAQRKHRLNSLEKGLLLIMSSSPILLRRKV